jgi:predicted 3-demethylubiquinone-9 3-methyltransferase (glyoxalase superfamily)
MAQLQRITPFLWFDNQAEEAARFYTGVFKNSRITKQTRYGEAGKEAHHRPPGSVMTVEFELDGQKLLALNGGPQQFKFNESLSLVINCQTQEEIDYYWEKLTQGGDPKAQQCGWLKDKYGLSWQVVPEAMADLFQDENSEAAGRTMEAMLKMKKLDMAELKRAHAGDAVGVRA